MAYVKKLLRLASPEKMTDTPAELTHRETIAMQYLAEGLSNREIAERMGISVATVKSHVNRIYRKMNVSGKTARFRRSAKSGIPVGPPSDR